MFLQINALLEWQFLYYLTAVILGVQIAFYFFFQYYKVKDENLQLNRILLSYGAFILYTIIGAFFLVIVRLIDMNPDLEEILYRIGFAVILYSPIGFFSFIIGKDFWPLLNLGLTKILIALNIIPIVVILLFGSESLIFRYTIWFMVLSALYIIYIQIRLISKTKGDIRKRLSEFFIGEILCLSALVFAAQVSFDFFGLGVPEISFFIGTSLLIIGFLIIFLAVYEFPAFLEMGWKLDLIKFFIINQNNNSYLYSYDFAEIHGDASTKQKRDELFTRGLTGIDNIISAITDTQQEKIYKIKQEDSFVLLEYGTKFSTPIVYAMVVKRDLKSIRYFLKNLKEEFESFYNNILLYLGELEGSQVQLFEGFDVLLKKLIY